MLGKGKELFSGLVNNQQRVLFWLVILIALVYRGIILVKYASVYVDDDQALMWNGAAAFARFHFPEPCFWGQPYGSMFESFVAVPFVWLRMPFHIALPLSTMLISFFPFLYASIELYKRESISAATFCIMIFVLMGWRWDVLTSIPRSFISGVPFAVLGAILMNKDSSKSVLAGALLSSVGIIMTNTMAAVVSIGMLQYALHLRGEIKNLAYLVSGFLIGGIIYLFVRNFYVVNADYSLHPNLDMSFSFETLERNIRFLVELVSGIFLAQVSVVGTVTTMLIVLGLVVGGSAYLKNWSLAGFSFVILLETLLLLSMNKTRDFNNVSVLFSQARMFLFIPYAMLVSFFFWTVDCGHDVKWKRNASALVGTLIPLFSIVGICALKTFELISEKNRTGSSLTTPCVINIQRVDSIYEAIYRIGQRAQAEQADVVVIASDDRALAYAFDAVCYGQYITYNATYDRRTWNYHELQHVRPRHCVFVTTSAGSMNMEIIDIQDQSVVDYIAKKYGVFRDPNPSRGIEKVKKKGVSSNAHPFLEVEKLGDTPFDILFWGKKYNAWKYITNGIDQPGGGVSWTLGKRMDVTIPVKSRYKDFDVRIVVAAPFHGRQRWIASQNDSIVAQGELESAGDMSFLASATKGALAFSIDFPDAKRPCDVDQDSKDSRLIAMPIKRIRIGPHKD